MEFLRIISDSMAEIQKSSEDGFIGTGEVVSYRDIDGKGATVGFLCIGEKMEDDIYVVLHAKHPRCNPTPTVP